ncbi:Cytochrome P450 [Caenorhabditis elegans]|uniref:Cytochrome P450 n=1 Tax=Caenorhabditis elegans TaxID=6239 RepID=O01911_CAEEL|nr:Cytochrome P450 [Caenorhabditis elegans]CCD72206.1 Cytochrome P450 [Caenorhabditis elegans]|eukprot:NP_497640.1 Uncharacterized protein CELE_R10F2.5 [Caenorhabditis elegans]
MSSHAFPALYLNLGVEMMYVLDQRLRVQKERVEDREKSDKVVKEIMLGFLAKKTLDEVFKGHGTPTRVGLKMFFEKVAHCSIMRLNENSMDKLFDLMMMSYKFALMKMTMPEQIMTITVNHLRALLDLVPLDKDIGAAVEHAYTMAFTFYRPLGPMGWFMLRNSLLVFFQDTRVKVSMFIKDCRQLPNGRFVLFDKASPVQLMLGGEPVGLTKVGKKSEA